MSRPVDKLNNDTIRLIYNTLDETNFDKMLKANIFEAKILEAAGIKYSNSWEYKFDFFMDLLELLRTSFEMDSQNSFGFESNGSSLLIQIMEVDDNARQIYIVLSYTRDPKDNNYSEDSRSFEFFYQEIDINQPISETKDSIKNKFINDILDDPKVTTLTKPIIDRFQFTDVTKIYKNDEPIDENPNISFSNFKYIMQMQKKGGKNKTPTKYTKSNEKLPYKGRQRVIYLSPRGVKYVKDSGTYKKYKER